MEERKGGGGCWCWVKWAGGIGRKGLEKDGRGVTRRRGGGIWERGEKRVRDSGRKNMLIDYYTYDL